MTSDKCPAYLLRNLTKDMKEALKEAGKREGRSINAEIIHRLKKSLAEDQKLRG